MIAYFVHNSENQNDIVVLPELGCSVPVDDACLKSFISANPDFSKWSGVACGNLTPEDFGTIVSIRDDCGDVSVRNQKLWQERMEYYLG